MTSLLMLSVWQIIEKEVKMAYIKYRGATHVPVKVMGKVKRNGKVMVKVKTTKALPHRPKGSIDYRSPDKVY